VPAMSILGLSTPDEFTAALQGESIDNGLLNRFLALPSTVRIEETDPPLDTFVVPTSEDVTMLQNFLNQFCERKSMTSDEHVVTSNVRSPALMQASGLALDGEPSRDRIRQHRRRERSPCQPRLVATGAVEKTRCRHLYFSRSCSACSHPFRTHIE
jgi:hypothetical protein